MPLPAPAFQLPADIAPAVPPTAAPPPPPPVEPVIPMAFMAEKYRQLRERKDAIKARHLEELKPFIDAMNQIEGLMQRQLNDANATSMRTEGGTVIQATRRSITVEDPEKFRQWAEVSGHTGMYGNRVSKEAVEEYVGKGNPLPPGLKMSAVTSIQVRNN